MRLLYLLAAAITLPLSSALAQSVRSTPLAPPPFAFSFGQQICRQQHLTQAAHQQARRVTTASRRHEQLMSRYDLKFARIDIGLERTSNEIGAGTNALLLARNVSATTPLDTIGLELVRINTLFLDSLLVNGQRVPTARISWLADGALRIAPVQPIAPATDFSVQVWYHGVPTTSSSTFFGNGLGSTAVPGLGNRVTWTFSSPFTTHHWWPCKQVLLDKLDSVEVHVTTSADNKAGSNGLLERTVTLPNGKVRYEWKSRYPIDYYLVSVTVSQYAEHLVYAHPAGMPNGDSIPILTYLYPQQLPQAAPVLNATAPMLENFSAKVGLYPFWQEKYGHCLAPIGGGMEHQTMTLLGFPDYGLIAHELFHQWFGDNVTCASYRDIWLNEGFATYGEYLTIQAFGTPVDANQWLLGNRGGAFQAFGSVVVPAADTLNVQRIFSGALTYAKGAQVVHMLRHVVNNDSAFFAALRAYQQQFGGSTATTDDLRQSLEASLNMPLQWFFDQWAYGEGYARSTFRWNQVGNDLLIESVQVSTAPASVPFFRMPIEFDYTPGAGQPAVTVRLEQNQPTQVWTIPLPPGTTITNVLADPRRWNLLQILRIRRDNTFGVTGLAEEASPRLTVYPNPCTDFLSIPAAVQERTAEVVDLAGRVVSRHHLPAAADRLPTASLAAGTYLLRLSEPGFPPRQVRFTRN